jgi:xanthine dehydrogenase accessory factor
MLDILTEINRWIEEDRPFALATVIQTWGSSPRGAGSAMAIREDMQIAGSVSSGCVENEVIEAALDTIKTGKPKILEFGVSDDKAWSVGLSCGGTIKVFVEKHPAFSMNPAEQEIWNRLTHAIEKNKPCILLKNLSASEGTFDRHLLVFSDGSYVGDWGELTFQAREAALRAYDERRSETVEIKKQEIFAQVFRRKPKLIIIGGSHVAVELVKFSSQLGFEATIIDPRKVFTSTERFPVQPQKIISEWPEKVLPDLDANEDTYAVLLTHDPKIDDEALRVLLPSNVAYIGALGSKKTHAKRCARLEEAGFSEAQIARIFGPIGLDINASSPAEIALSIMGEIIKTKNTRQESKKAKEKSEK